MLKELIDNKYEHLRTRIKAVIWKQWKIPNKRQEGLEKLGLGQDKEV